MKYIVKIDAFLLQRQSDFIQSNSSIYLLNNPCVSLFKRKAASFMGCYSYSAKSMCFFFVFCFFVSSFLAFLNLTALCVWLGLIEIESLLSRPFPLSGFYPYCDLVIGVNYPYSSEFWLFFKVYVMRNVHLITSLISNFSA